MRPGAVEHIAVVISVTAEGLYERKRANPGSVGVTQQTFDIDRMLTMPTLLVADGGTIG
jgi:hypothetical protein